MSESNLLTGAFSGGSIQLSSPVEDPTDTGATVSCESNYEQGVVYNYVKDTAFTGDAAAQAQEIKDNGTSQPATLGPSAVIPDQTQDTPYYVGWYQDEHLDIIDL